MLFKPPSPWYFVMTALENLYISQHPKEKEPSQSRFDTGSRMASSAALVHEGPLRKCHSLTMLIKQQMLAAYCYTFIRTCDKKARHLCTGGKNGTILPEWVYCQMAKKLSEFYANILYRSLL